MAEKEDIVQRIYRNIFVVLIAVTVIFIIIVGFYNAKIEQHDVCERSTISNMSGIELVNGPVLDDNITAYYYKYDIETNLHGYSLCYLTNGTGNPLFETQVLNENGTILGTSFLRNETQRTCTRLDPTKLKESQYLGVLCVNCGQGIELSIRRDVAGQTIDYVSINATSASLYQQTPLSYSLIIEKDCKGLVTFFMRWYITIIALILVIFLFFFGGTKFKEELWEMSK